MNDVGGDDWLIVPNWRRFQHYHDRRPQWIKVYTDLLHDPDYLRLSLAAKGLLQMIWLVYSQQDCVVSVADLQQICRKRVSKIQLMSLNHAGFIRFAASKPLAHNEEVEEKEEGPVENTRPKVTRRAPTRAAREKVLREAAFEAATGWSGDSESFGDHLDELERLHGAHLNISVRERLWDHAFPRSREHPRPDP